MPPLRSKKSKTSRFPVARIKKIMQLDEEVGKLASVTPVMISKSLECFMQLLIDASCKETRERGSRKLTAYHLKAAINANESLDFLRDIVAAVPDPVESKPTTTKTRKEKDPTAEPKKRKSKNGVKGEVEREAADLTPPPVGGSLPQIGTWKKEAEGEGGT
ncbi:Dr1-associated corepressor, partial [Tremellales sp. Uapishka_1]